MAGLIEQLTELQPSDIERNLAVCVSMAIFIFFGSGTPIQSPPPFSVPPRRKQRINNVRSSFVLLHWHVIPGTTSLDRLMAVWTHSH